MVLGDSITIPTVELLIQIEKISSLAEVLYFMNSSIDPEQLEKQIYKEGASDIWSVIRFRDKISDMKDYLQSHQLDFEEDINRRRSLLLDSLSEVFSYGDLYYENMLTQLIQQRESLIYERESLLYHLMTDEMYPTYLKVERGIDQLDKQIQSVRNVLNHKDELVSLNEARKTFGEILKKIQWISASVNNYLAESKHASLIKEFNNDLLFADIIDVTYDLFNELFDPEMTKVQLLLALNLRGQGRIPILSRSMTAISVMIYTIISGYDPYSDTWKGDREEWARMVADFFGIGEKSYEARRYAKNSVLHKMWKERVCLFEEYLASLEDFKQKTRAMLAVKQSENTN